MDPLTLLGNIADQSKIPPDLQLMHLVFIVSENSSGETTHPMQTTLTCSNRNNQQNKAGLTSGELPRLH